jgi:hypothetical protein
MYLKIDGVTLTNTLLDLMQCVFRMPFKYVKMGNPLLSKEGPCHGAMKPFVTKIEHTEE